MRCVPALLGAACCAALPIGWRPQNAPAVDGRSFGEIAEVSCGDGRTITLGEEAVVTQWKLTGACTLLSGRIKAGAAGPGKSRLIIDGGTLYVEGVNFLGVGVSAYHSTVDVVRSTFSFTEGAAKTKTAVDVPKGGGIEAANDSQVSLTEVNFSHVTAEEGGGVYVHRGKLTVVGCRFVETIATSRGGAIAIYGAQLLVQDTEFLDTCAGSQGGAIFLEPAAGASGKQLNNTLEQVSFLRTQADPECGNGTIDRNEIHGIGGAVRLTGGSLRVAESYFEGNIASYGGGAVHATEISGSPSFVYVTNSTFEGLTAGEGGVIFQNGGVLIMEGGIHVNRSAARRNGDLFYHTPTKSRGGVVCMTGGTTVLRDVNIAESQSDGDGGSIYQQGGKLTLENVTIISSKCVNRERVVSHGGAVFSVQAEIQARNFNVTEGRADFGGCIFIDKSGEEYVRFEHINLTSCKARGGDGGSMYTSRVSRFDLKDALMVRGRAGEGGGCLRIQRVASGSITNLMVENCNAMDGGGGMDIHRSELVFTGSKIVNARARFGGGIAIEGESWVRLDQTDISNTNARTLGAAVHVIAMSVLDAQGLRISDAHAATGGGGFYVYDSHIVISDFAFQRHHAGISGQSIAAVNSVIELRRGKWINGRTESLWSFSKCHVVCSNVRIKMPLKGQFAALDNTDTEFDNFRARCFFRSEYVNRTLYSSTELSPGTYRLLCEPCGAHEGIRGLDWVMGKKEKCFPCPPNAEGCRLFGCVCKPGYVLNNTRLRYRVDDVLQDDVCVQCAKAMLDCPLDEDFCGDREAMRPRVPTLNCTRTSRNCQQVLPVAGSWRMPTSLHAAVPCPFRPACAVPGRCEEGYKGPMCMVCEAGRYRKGRFRACRPCDVHVVSDVIFWVGLLCLSLAIFATRFLKKVRYAVTDVRDTIEGHTSYVRVKFKLVTFIMQAFSTLQELHFPASRVVDEVGVTVTPIITLDVFASKHIAICRLGLDSFCCYGLTLAQLVLVIAVILSIRWNFDVEVDWMVLTAYNYMLMGIVKESLTWFLCDSDVKAMTGASYLLSDYSVECRGFKYYLVMTVAGCVLVIWCIGIPGFLYWRMFRWRRQLNPQMEVSVSSSDSLLETEVRSVFTQMAQDYMTATKCYGLATMLCASQQTGLLDRNAVDTGKLTVSFQEVNKNISLEEVMRIRSIAAGSTLMRLNNQELMKRGLRAMAERQNPSLKAYQNFYRQYKCGRWYYEFISIFGRIGFALVMVLPASLQCLAGLALAGLMLLVVCWLRPFKRRSDNYVASVCYLAMLGLFGAFTANVKKQTLIANYVSGICLAIPLLAFVHYALRFYCLPGRQNIWTVEKADQLFDEEFARSRLAPRDRRQKQEIELSVLQGAGLVAAWPEKRDTEDSCEG